MEWSSDATCPHTPLQSIHRNTPGHKSPLPSHPTPHARPSFAHRKTEPLLTLGHALHLCRPLLLYTRCLCCLGPCSGVLPAPRPRPESPYTARFPASPPHDRLRALPYHVTAARRLRIPQPPPTPHPPWRPYTLPCAHCQHGACLSPCTTSSSLPRHTRHQQQPPSPHEPPAAACLATRTTTSSLPQEPPAAARLGPCTSSSSLPAPRTPPAACLAPRTPPAAAACLGPRTTSSSLPAPRTARTVPLRSKATLLAACGPALS
jgi:hypothetical protein